MYTVRGPQKLPHMSVRINLRIWGLQNDPIFRGYHRTPESPPLRGMFPEPPYISCIYPDQNFALHPIVSGFWHQHQVSRGCRDGKKRYTFSASVVKSDSDKLYPIIYYALKRTLKEWEEAMDERPGKHSGFFTLAGITLTTFERGHKAYHSARPLLLSNKVCLFRIWYVLVI